jgi:sigma-E factor negative regulatory protein RseA
MSSAERESQISAMFDGELPEAECELLARRLLRESSLRASWGRYALIGAALRSEPLALRGAGRHDLAERVRAELDGEPLLDAPQVRGTPRGVNWYKGALGVALAAGVAALSIMVLRVEVPQAPDTVALATPPVPARVASAQAPAVLAARGPDSAAPAYIVPPTSDQLGVRTSAQLANYVVAHSEYATPVARLNRLSSFMTSDIDADDDTTDTDSTDSGAAPVNAQLPR